jgi:hypothetical protein
MMYQLGYNEANFEFNMIRSDQMQGFGVMSQSEKPRDLGTLRVINEEQSV